MCELLIKAVDNPGDDTQYKAGDPVVVMEDGHTWGRFEGPPDFYVVKLPGVDPDLVRQYITSQLDESDPDAPVILKKRLYRWRADIGRLENKVTLATYIPGQ